MMQNHPLAMPNFKGDVFYLNDEIFHAGLEASRKSPRKRMIFPIQRTQDDEVQRLINFLQPGTYIRPHRHPQPHATETIQVVSGALCFLVFDADGNETGRYVLKPGPSGCALDILPGVWHSFFVLMEDTVIIEVKKGPYDKEKDKEFAKWAPDEGMAEARALLKKWEESF